MGIWGVGDPRDLDSLGLARAQPGPSQGGVQRRQRSHLDPPSAGDTAGWTLGWTSGSPPLYNTTTTMVLPGMYYYGVLRADGDLTGPERKKEPGCQGKGVRTQGSSTRSGSLQNGLLFLDLVSGILYSCTWLQNSPGMNDILI